MEPSEQPNAEPSPPGVMSVRRRFGIPMLLVATTVCAALLGWLQWLDLGAGVMAATLVFVAGIAGAQAFLGGGKYPRRASVVAGSILFPLVLIAMLFAKSRHPDWALPIGVYFTMALCTAPVGAVAGYLIGAVVGAIFAAVERPAREDHTETSPRSPATGHFPDPDGDARARPRKGNRWWLVPLVAAMIAAWTAAGWVMYRFHSDVASEATRRQQEELADLPTFQRVEQAAQAIERLGGQVPDRDAGSYGRYRTVILTGWRGKDADLALLRDFVGLINVRQLHYRGVKIDASGTALSDDAVPYLLELCDVLVRLDIRGTQLTADGAKRLQQGLPYCKVFY